MSIETLMLLYYGLGTISAGIVLYKTCNCSEIIENIKNMGNIRYSQLNTNEYIKQEDEVELNGITKKNETVIIDFK